MRIPPEAIPPVANVGKEIEGERKVEPVAGVTRVSGDFAATLQEQPVPLTPSDRKVPVQSPGTATVGPLPEPSSVPVERRQAERRSENRPVLLDTRSNRGRRRGADDARINIEV